MAAITREQIKEIRTLTRRANRRIERATPGQRSALNYYVNKATGADKFSASTKGLTQEQAAAKLRDLETFLNSPSSTRKGWDRIKEENVRKANETLSEEGYDLTDEELAEILEQIDTKNKKDYYRRNRVLCIVGMLAVYGLAMIDAYVDAQLYTFDISPDVSMKLSPAVLEATTKTPAVMGLQCSFVF